MIWGYSHAKVKFGNRRNFKIQDYIKFINKIITSATWCDIFFLLSLPNQSVNFVFTVMSMAKSILMNTIFRSFSVESGSWPGTLLKLNSFYGPNRDQIAQTFYLLIFTVLALVINPLMIFLAATRSSSNEFLEIKKDVDWLGLPI